MKYEYDRNNIEIKDDDFTYVGKRNIDNEIETVRKYNLKSFYIDFKNNKLLFLLFILFSIILIISISEPFISKYSYYEQFMDNKYLKITDGIKFKHYLGTDFLGRDFFARISQGIRISIFISIIVTVISSVLGIIYGSFSAYKGKMYDLVMFRIVEIIMSIPSLIYIIIFVMIFGNSIMAIIISLVFTRWIYYSMIVRAEVLKLKKSEYIIASKSMGGNFFWILRKHIIPNCISVIIVKTAIDIPSIIFNEAFLSFVGLGIPFPKASLGNLVFDGFKEINNRLSLFIIPVFVLIVISLFFNLLSDFLNDKFNS